MPEGGAVRCVSSGCLSNGAEGQNRTVDTSLFRAVLYQLSYLGTDVTAPHLAEAEKSRNFAPTQLLRTDRILPRWRGQVLPFS